MVLVVWFLVGGGRYSAGGVCCLIMAAGDVYCGLSWRLVWVVIIWLLGFGWLCEVWV